MSEDSGKFKHGKTLDPVHGPAVHIAPEHQSAPKKSWADVEVDKAAEEISEGKFKPVFDDDDLMLAVGVQRGDLPESPLDIDPFSTLRSLALAQHPRVQEALARLEQEKRDAKTSQEAIEKSQMLYEMNKASARINRWDGQERWEGDDDARIGLILTPFQFMERLMRVIGEQRIKLNRFAVNKRVALLVPDKEPAPLIVIPGAVEPPRKDGMKQVATLQWPCGSEWMVMRFDQYGIPTTPKYLGWRTALLALIREGIITEKEAHKAFPVGMSQSSEWYREQLQEIRSERGIVN